MSVYNMESRGGKFVVTMYDEVKHQRYQICDPIPLFECEELISKLKTKENKNLQEKAKELWRG